MNYLLIYFSALLITLSVIGHGFILSRLVNKELLTFNVGYIGLIGLLSLVIISYVTIFFVKHDYLHNLILHSVGLVSFFFHIKERETNGDIFKLLILFSILFCGLLIIRNHDDFNYYHFTYSLGLTENKIFFGLGNFQHGYKHHSSIFFLNSIIYLPFIKFYLFHSISWITLVFVNFIILDFILNKKKIEKFDFKLVFYLITFLFINFKFYRIGGHGTDISGQLILFILLPLIYSSLKKDNFKTNLDIIILLISYIVTLKAFFILNFIFLFSFFAFHKIKKIFRYILSSKAILTSFITLSLLTSINISYTGCAIYPIKQSCFFKEISWTLKKNDVEHLSQWYEIWAKAGAGPNYGVENPEIYIEKFNWVSNWYGKYFEYKGLETIGGILFLLVLLIIIFYSKNKKIPNQINKKIILILYFLSFILFFEWFYNRPSLRYGGYYLLCFMFFIPFSYYLSNKKFKFKRLNKSIISLILLSFLLFNFKNITRISDEIKMVKENKFPFFYAPTQQYEMIQLDSSTRVYIPDKKYNGCWVIKTPCVAGVDHIKVKKKFGYTIFFRK
jgi:hypothetical protein